MLRLMVFAVVCLLLIACMPPVSAQQPAANGGVVPSMVKFTGTVTDVNNKPLTGTVEVTVSLYKDSEGGAPLWMETQNVQADKAGHYSVMLGSTSSRGLPADLFISGEARWLAVRAEGQAEQPRTLLLSVPYALKAADAQTLGGLPPSAYMLAAPSNHPGGTAISLSESSAPPPNAAITGTGTANFLPLWDTSSNIVNSVLFQSGTGATTRIGINTTTPTSTLDVKGSATVRGTLALPTNGTATTAAGKNSQPLNLVASSFNSGTGTPSNQSFRLQAEPAGNNTKTSSGTLNLLYASGANALAETGLKFASNGKITFAKGQTFPTVSSVALSAPATDFTVSGSPVTNSGTLGLSWNIAPTNSNTPNAIVKRDSGGNVDVTTINANSSSNLFAVVGVGGVYGSGPIAIEGKSTGDGFGVAGFADADGTGVYGQGRFGLIGDGGGDGVGVQGLGQYGVEGFGNANGTGVYGTGYIGVSGIGTIGMEGVASTGGYGVYARNTGTGDALVAENQTGGYAGYFAGDVFVNGTLSKSGGSFKIDHPLDPANKYLSHSFVESPDMMNIYDGVAVLDANGEAVVPMPDWFGVLNRDFRYQLTCIGGFAPVYVAEEISDSRFKIGGGKPGMKVSWQVTGIRHDAWANAHRIPVEQAKPERERGLYLHPELFGAPAGKSIALARHPEATKHAPETQPQSPLRQTPVPAQR